MAKRARSYGKHALLPVGMTDFLKRRAGQFMGFFVVCLAICLAGILWTYDPSDPSWNLAIDGPAKNILGYSGAVVADILLQTFGLAGGFVILGFLGWGTRSMLGIPLRWAFFRSITFLLALLLSASVLALWKAPQSWMLPNSIGGAFGDSILHRTYGFVGKGIFSRMGILILFSSLSATLFILSLGIPFKQLRRILATVGSILVFAIQYIYEAVSNFVIWFGGKIFGTRNELLGKKSRSTKSQPHSEFSHTDSNTLQIVTPREVEGGLKVTEDDRLMHSSSLDRPDGKEDTKAKIVWGDHFTTPTSEDDSQEDFAVFENTKKTLPSTDSQQNSSETYAMGWEEYQLPSLELLDASLRKATQDIDPQTLEESAFHLKTVLEEFGVRGEFVTVRPGPVVTMYEFKPAAGIKTSRVIGLADDIARSMSALSARIAVIPGRNVIGIELPNSNRETVYLRELLQSETYEKSTTHLALILGKDIGGQPVIADLTRMPHLLVAGTTGSGKSVAVNTMILSLLFRLPPDRCKFIMIDPKMLELSVYDGIPHLLSPVVTDPKKAIVALKWAVREMENRYRAMSKLGVRNIDGYNVRIKEARKSGEMLVRRVQTGFDPDSGKPIFENQPLDLDPLPYIVVVVDEMADLMMVAGKEIEAAVQRLAQMARAAGIHLIMATQRPSVDVITGTIKANFPTRISFQVTSKIDSRTILGEQGAEQLLGQGDMLYMAGGGRITRVHGPFVTDHEVERIVGFLKSQAEPVYVEGVTDEEGEFIQFDDDGGKGQDTLYNQAVELVIREGKASTSFIQRHLQIGYNKAAGIIETMEKNGVVSAANHVGRREVLGR